MAYNFVPKWQVLTNLPSRELFDTEADANAAAEAHLAADPQNTPPVSVNQVTEVEPA